MASGSTLTDDLAVDVLGIVRFDVSGTSTAVRDFGGHFGSLVAREGVLLICDLCGVSGGAYERELKLDAEGSTTYRSYQGEPASFKWSTNGGWDGGG